MTNNLAAKFDAAMFEVYQRAKVWAGYNANIYLRMINDRGDLAAAKYLINGQKPSDVLPHYGRGGD